MNVLYLWEELYDLGGAQVQIHNWTQWLSANGHECWVATQPTPPTSDPGLRPAVERHARVVELDHEDWVQSNASALTAAVGRVPDVIVCFSLASTLLALAAADGAWPDARLVLHWIFPSRLNASSRAPVLQLLVKALESRLPTESALFMNADCRRVAESQFGNRMTAARVVRLTIEERALRRTRPARRKIVSIARYSPEHPHPFWMPDVLAECASRGVSLEFASYGWGPLRAELETTIASHPCRDNIRVHGRLARADFATIVGDAYAVVATGTTLLEAAALGVPSLELVAFCKVPLCYGFFHETDGFELGGARPGTPHLRVADELIRLSLLDDSHYMEFSAREHAKARLVFPANVGPSLLAAYAAAARGSEILPKWLVRLAVAERQALGSIRRLRDTWTRRRAANGA